MNQASVMRRNADLEKLRNLEKRIPDTLKIVNVSGNPPTTIRIQVSVPTARSASYPQEVQTQSQIDISFPLGYPLPSGPEVYFRTPIWNPNVFSSGRWCFGEWKITENLELFVIRLIKVIALDPTIINPGSAANSQAAQWYSRMRASQPRLFPTISVDSLFAASAKPKMTWNNLS